MSVVPDKILSLPKQPFRDPAGIILHLLCDAEETKNANTVVMWHQSSAATDSYRPSRQSQKRHGFSLHCSKPTKSPNRIWKETRSDGKNDVNMTIHTWTNMTENREVYALESIHCEQRPFFQSPKAKDVMTVSGTMAGRHLLSVVLESFSVLLTC
ncbi:predicted protein [Aspergillus nidulans FGSC A4]|uniref:Uncharacterized protein n=1 Tax=Emericella nidulans (strain FGSC A4 / ATCC 38163 / CBS 112.46 / NRRL 194 / M139) TaxID=227321 RepID=Q5ASZ1_EMENI|nr:hypothetical protein [Aspergillus nidulans FGSC A4]EAA60623.1 predicted protein [Aspergillus nidulans FGSC A4]CBF78382.1 TPA: hypothetical protein ANIA_08589 [Aspergillus nidulans FGSC A4]|eukprot:XP_681858.1 predicted protein [Aspergillus nidulans FGSC A4]